MAKIKFSVIVPIHNAEKYLEDCLDSILQQTCMPQKIILIDDGSTDRSGEICDRYGRENSNIAVIHQERQGVAVSRKKGIEHVETEYVTFLDADDWIDTDLFEQMAANLSSETVDIVITGTIYEYENCQKRESPGIPKGIYSKEEFHSRFLCRFIYDYQRQRNGIKASLWAKLYRIDLLKQELCDVSSELTLGEDGAVVYPLLVKAAGISVSAYCGYHYRRHKTSRTANLNMEDFQQAELLQKHLYRKFEEEGLLEIGKQQLDHFLMECLKSIIGKNYGIDMGEASLDLPYWDIPVNSRIVLYGAGKVGMACMRNLLPCRQYSIVLWADKKRRGLCYGYKIVVPQEILNIGFDFVLIAIENEEISENVKEELADMGIPTDKTIWFPIKWR